MVLYSPMPMGKSVVGVLLVDMERFDCSEGEEGKHFGSGSNESAVVDNDESISLPFIEALVVDNWLRRV